MQQSNLLDKLPHIRAFVFDVDGVMTDGSLLLLEDGEWLRTMNIKDGYAIRHAADERYHIAVISGSGSEAIRKRMEALGVQDIFMLSENKLSVYEKFLLDKGIHTNEVLYMGDDIPDLEVMKAAGIAACPADAVEEVKQIADIVTLASGGKGCIREVIEMVLKAQDRWLKS
ncbi:MAG: HAD hydrolase family protein [Bacteroidetes bacterium]|nr:HAD hydrolase family protein [Bacteroidota bacterium]